MSIISELGVKNENILINLCCVADNSETLRKKLLELNEIDSCSTNLWQAQFRNPLFKESLPVKEFGHYDSYQKFLAEKLDVHDELRIQQLRRSYPYIFRINPLKFMNKMKFFTNAGYTKQELQLYPHIFYLSMDTLKNRMAMLQEAGIQKPWLSASSRNNQEFLQSLKTQNLNELQKHSIVEEEAAQYKSYLAFLAAKFNVDEEVMVKKEDWVLKKYPFFFRMRPSTFSRKLEFLVNTGYKSEELLNSMYIFSNKISTLKIRILRLQELGIQKPCLSILIKSSPKFEEYVNSLPLNVRNNEFEKHNEVAKEVAQYKTYEEFLAAKLKVDRDFFEGVKDKIQSKYPYFFKMRPLRFAEKSKFFLNMLVTL